MQHREVDPGRGRDPACERERGQVLGTARERDQHARDALEPAVEEDAHRALRPDDDVAHGAAQVAFELQQG